MKTRLLLLAGLFAAVAAPAHAGFTFYWSAPGSVNVNEGYSVSVQAYFSPSNSGDPYAVLELYRNGAQAGGGSTGPYGTATASNSFNDSSPQTVSYSAEAYSYYGETDYSSHSVTVNGAPPNSPPSAWVTVDGHGSGASLTRPYGGSTAVTVRYKASDANGNLTGIRPQIWHPNGSLDNNAGNFVGQSGGYGEVAWTVNLDQDGDWYFWTDAQDSVIAPGYVDSGSWGSGFRLTVVQGAPPNTPPSVTLLAPSAQTINLNQALTLTSQATDPDGNLVSHNLDIQRPDGSWNWQGGFAYGEPYMGGPVGSAGNSTRSAGFTFNQVGTWYVRSYGHDSAGHGVHSATVAITVINPNQPPTGTVRVNPASIYTGQQVVVSVDATDANGNLRYINIDQTSPTNGFYGPGDTGTETPPNNGAYDLGGYFGSRTRNLTLTLNTPGTYVFRGAMNDDSAWYCTPNTVSVTVSNAGQGPVSLSPSSQTVASGQSVLFTASGGSGTGDYVWGGDASGTGASKTVTFNTAGPRTVTVYRAASAGYNQSNTASASITVDGSAPGAPQNLQISGVTDTGFTVSWTAPSGEAVAGYRVRLDSGAFTDVGTYTSHTFTGLAAGSAHIVEVQARDAATNWSAAATYGVTTSGGGGGAGTAAAVFWMDTNGDGILDKVTGSNSPRFYFYIDSWQTERIDLIGVPVQAWLTTIGNLYAGTLYDNYTRWWEPQVNFEVGYDTHFRIAFRVETEADRPQQIYVDYSRLTDINRNRWYPLLSLPGFATAGWHEIYHDIFDPGLFNRAQYFLVEEGKPLVKVGIKDTNGNDLIPTQVGSEETATVNLPADGKLMIPVYAENGQEIPIETGGHGLTWIIEKVVNGVTTTINGVGKILDVSPILPLPNGQVVVKLKLDNREQPFTFVLAMPNTGWTIQILDRDKNPVSQLKVAKLTEPDVIDEYHPYALDPDADSDRYYIRVIDPSKRGTNPEVLLWTEPPGPTMQDLLYSDSRADLQKNRIILEDDPTSNTALISKALLLMSDDKDDDHQVAFVSDDATNDRTRIVALGGKVRAQYLANSAPSFPLRVDVEAAVPVRTGKPTIHVNVVILRNRAQAEGGTPVADQATVESHLKIAQERYAQVGLKLTWDSEIPVIDPPSNVEIQTTGLTVSSESHKVHSEARTLIQASGTAGNNMDIHVFYVNAAVGLGDIDRGHALAEYHYSGGDEAPYRYNAFVSALTMTPFTLAHELAHLLADIGHYSGIGDDFNLLTWKSTSSSNSFTATKRLNADQEARIHSNPRTQN
ncbi:MAG: fibronectin type III domain-containing protein [Verrucomicrobiota bacterium]